jgi:hypothetical protein
MKQRILKLLAVLACFGWLTSGLAEDAVPVGTVNLTTKSVAVGVGVQHGQGTLNYNGLNRKFTINGLSVVDLGISKINATGEVFHMNNIDDFSGNYVAGAAGIAVAGGVDDVVMQNEKGVVLRLHGVEKGVRLQLGGQGVTVKLRS